MNPETAVVVAVLLAVLVIALVFGAASNSMDIAGDVLSGEGGFFEQAEEKTEKEDPSFLFESSFEGGQEVNSYVAGA